MGGNTKGVKIVALAGSLRKASYNKKLVKIAVEGARQAGAKVSQVDLKDFSLPIFNQDIEDESGIPENAVLLKELFKASDGFIFASPEYNSALSGALKNVIDWTSRPYSNEKVLECFRGKTAVLMSASPGALGGLRGLFVLRSILQNIGTMVIPEQVAISKADSAFKDDDSLVDDRRQERVENLGIKLTETIAKLKGLS